MRISEKFNYHESGLRKWLPPSETLLLEYMIDHPGGSTIKQIHHGVDLRSTTIGSLLTSLRRKGLITKDPETPPTYRPSGSRHEIILKLITNTLAPLLRDHPRETLQVLKTFLPQRTERISHDQD